MTARLQHSSTLLISLLFAALLSACSSQEGAQREDPFKGFTTGAKVTSIPNYRLRDWRALSDQQLFIEAVGGRHYLITLENRCDGLTTADTIGITNSAGQVTIHDRVLVPQQFDRMRRCTIRMIEQLDQAAPSLNSPL